MRGQSFDACPGEVDVEEKKESSQAENRGLGKQCEWSFEGGALNRETYIKLIVVAAKAVEE